MKVNLSITFYLTKPKSKCELYRSPIFYRQSVRKLLTFLTSYQEPLSQFQLHLAQIIHGKWEFMFVEIKGHTLLQGEIINIIEKLSAYFKTLLLKHSSNVDNVDASLLKS